MFSEPPEFVSYRGLYKTAFDHSQLLQTIEHLLDIVRKSHDATATSETRPDVRLLDTFFSDTLEENQLADILRLCKDFHGTLRILILNPHSPFAVARGKSLHQDPMREINKAIMRLRRAIRHVHGILSVLPSTPTAEQFDSEEFLNQQLDQLQIERKGIDLGIKFYDILTEMPVYIISNFAAKGLIIDHHSAAYNPWMVFVDNPKQKGDIYDCLKNAFDLIWDNSSSSSPQYTSHRLNISVNSNNIFVSHAHNSAAARHICKYLNDELHFDLKVYTVSAVAGKSPFENLQAMTSECTRAVVVLTNDDEVTERSLKVTDGKFPKSQKRGRQNVIHEIGYCQAKMGTECVLILREKGVEVPSNFEYLHSAIFEGDNFADAFVFLAKNLHSPQRPQVQHMQQPTP